MRTGLDYIVDGSAMGTSTAMVILYSHATRWLETVDALTHGSDRLSLGDAKRAADLGFYGDDASRARHFLAIHKEA